MQAIIAQQQDLKITGNICKTRMLDGTWLTTDYYVEPRPQPIVLTREEREAATMAKDNSNWKYWVQATGNFFKEYNPYTDEL